MKIPRNMSGEMLIRLLRKLGYQVTRQVGSHVRLTTTSGGEHHITVPLHNPVRAGTLNGILSDVAAHFATTKEQILVTLLEEARGHDLNRNTQSEKI